MSELGNVDALVLEWLRTEAAPAAVNEGGAPCLPGLPAAALRHCPGRGCPSDGRVLCSTPHE